MARAWARRRSIDEGGRVEAAFGSPSTPVAGMRCQSSEYLTHIACTPVCRMLALAPSTCVPNLHHARPVGTFPASTRPGASSVGASSCRIVEVSCSSSTGLRRWHPAPW